MDASKALSSVGVIEDTRLSDLHIFNFEGFCPVAVWFVSTDTDSLFVRRSLLEEGVQMLSNWRAESTFPSVSRLLLHVPPIRDIDLDLVRSNDKRITFKRVPHVDNVLELQNIAHEEVKRATVVIEKAKDLHDYSTSLFSFKDSYNELTERPCLEQLAVRMFWEDKIRQMLSTISPARTGKLFRYLDILLIKARFTPRAAFELFLLNTVAHESEPLAAEQSWVPTSSIAWHPDRPLLGFQDVIMLVPVSKQGTNTVQVCPEKHILADFIERILLGKSTRSSKQAVYDACEEIIANTVLLRDKYTRELKAPYQLGVNLSQRIEFQRIFEIIDIDINDCEGFPHRLKRRIEDFFQGRCGSQIFSDGWQSKLAASGIQSDTKVFFLIAFIDFIYPELRRVPPYYSFDEEAVLAESVANSYEDLTKWCNLYLCDMPFRRDDMYLSMGRFIKNVFRYRGRREMAGWWQRYRADRFGFQIRSKMIRKYNPHGTTIRILWNMKKSFSRVVESQTLIELLKTYTIDNKWFNRSLHSDYIDGPFYIGGIFDAPCDNKLIERVAAVMLNANGHEIPDFVFGIGRRGTFCSTLVSLLSGTPMSSLTLRPKFDISPRAYKNKDARTAFVLDDCIKTGYTGHHILTWLQSDNEPGCKSIKNLTGFTFCRVAPYKRSNPVPKEVGTYLEQLDNLRLENKFEEKDSFKYWGTAPFIDVDLTGNVELNAFWVDKEPSQDLITSISETYLNHYKTAVKCLDKIGVDVLRKEILNITSTGLFYDYRTIGDEFKSRLLPLRFLQWILANRHAPLFIRKIRERLWRVLWEDGAKYKPELLFRHPKLLIILGVYFHRKLKELKTDQPNVLVANTRLSIPLAVSIALACRYDEEMETGYRIAIANDDGSRISGLVSLKRREEEIRIASVTNITTFGFFAKALSETIAKRTELAGITLRKTATCSLFDVLYLSEDAERDKDVFGRFFPLITLSSAAPEKLLKILPILDSHLMKVSKIDQLLKLFLICLTHHEGLRYNRAFIVQHKGGAYHLVLGVGPSLVSEAKKSWEKVPPLTDLVEMAQNKEGLNQNAFWLFSGDEGRLFGDKEESYLLKSTTNENEKGTARFNCVKLDERNILNDYDRMILKRIGSPERILISLVQHKQEPWYLIVDNLCLKDRPLLAADEHIIRDFANIFARHIERCERTIDSEWNVAEQGLK